MKGRLLKLLLKNLRGQVLLEGLIALSLASVILIAIVTAVASSVSTTRVSNLKNQANQFAQEAIELVRTQRGLDAGFYCLPGGAGALSGTVAPETCVTPNINNTFIRSVEVVEDGCASGVDNVQVTVAWAETTCDPGKFCQSVKLASCIDPLGGLIAGNFPTPTTNPSASPEPTSATPTPTHTPNAPTVNVSANNPNVSPGGSSTISWTSSNTTSCTSLAGLTNPIGTSGSQAKSGIATTTTYTVRCSNVFGATEGSTTVTVVPSPTINTFTATPTSVNIGGSTTLNWSTSNASSCTASGSWSGTKAASGPENRTNITSNQTYTLTCTNSVGVNSAPSSVNVNIAVPTVDISANPTTVTSGSSSTLTWSSTNATSCTASGGWSGSKGTSGTNVPTGNLTSTTTFTLTCTGPGGTSSPDSAVVTVTPASQQLIVNGSFETSPRTMWPYVGNSPFCIDNDSYCNYYTTPYGSWFIDLGDNYPNYGDDIYQTITIPSSATSVTLAYYVRIVSPETCGCDLATVKVMNSSGGLLTILRTYYDYNHSGSDWLYRTHDITSYKGQTVRIRFGSWNDASLPTAFMFDLITVTANF